MKVKKLEPVTCGQLTGLLVELGFEGKVYDEHNAVYYHEPTRWLFALPNRPPESPARESDYIVVRSQLDGIGRLDRDDFDAYFAGRTIARTR